MPPEQARRELASMQAELRDLLAYLDGLPPEVRRGQAFASYEQRAAELRRELRLNRVPTAQAKPTAAVRGGE